MAFFYFVLADQVRAIILGMMKIITGIETVAMGVITTMESTAITMEASTAEVVDIMVDTAASIRPFA